MPRRCAVAAARGRRRCAEASPPAAGAGAVSTGVGTRSSAQRSDEDAERMRNVGMPELRDLLLRRDDLVRAGWTRARIDGALADGSLRRLRRDCYAAEQDWRELWPESQHRAHILAVQEAAVVAPVLSFTSAAALHGRPLYRVRVERVRAAVAPVGRHSARIIARSRGELAEDDVTVVDGLRCTTLERTVFDLARLASPEVAIVCADAALGLIAGPPGGTTPTRRTGGATRCGSGSRPPPGPAASVKLARSSR